jgi:hypothetical protein
MRREPRGVSATFIVTKTYYVTVDGDNEEELFINAEELTNTDIDEDDFVEMEVSIKGNIEYDSF